MLLLSVQVRFTIMANRLINFLSKIPLIKKVIEPSLYGNYGVKTIFAALGILSGVARRVIFRVIYIAYLTFIGVVLYQAAAKGGYPTLFADYFQAIPVLEPLIAEQVIAFILTAWFIFSFIGSFTGPAIATPQSSDSDKVMVMYLRADASVYAKARTILAVIADVLLYLPYLVAAFIIAGIPVWCVLPMLIMFTAFRFIGEIINLVAFKHARWHFSRFPFTLFGLPVLAAVIYVPVYYGLIDWAAVLTNPLVMLSSIAVAIVSWLYINAYKEHDELIRDRIKLLEETINEIREKNKRHAASMKTAGAAKWHKSIDEKSLRQDKHKHKTGFAYLNAIFFERHSNFFRKKMLTRCGFILVPLILIAGLMYIESRADLGIGFLGRTSLPFDLSPIFFFVMYIASMGRVVTASVFSNCDIQMLHYSYYRTAETTVASFKLRFAVIFRYNMLISVLVSVSAIGSIRLLYGFMDYSQAGVFTILLILLGLLFAFNDLFLYYVIQPYDSAGASKSIVYRLINGVIYFAAYLSLQMRLDLAAFTIFIAMVTVLYLGVGALLLVRLAPKKFMLR